MKSGAALGLFAAAGCAPQGTKASSDPYTPAKSIDVARAGTVQTATVALGPFQGRRVLQVNLMAAGSLIVSLPVVALYLFFQREFISGVMAGAVKE